MNNMTPSAVTEITDGQIDKAVANYRAMLCKHRHELGSELVQKVLGSPEFAAEQFSVLCIRIEAMSNIIVRRVKVDRNRTPQAMLEATGCTRYLDDKIVASMPCGEGEEVNVYFFRLSCSISDVDLDKEYELRGLKPADPYSQAAANEIDPNFADEHPNGTHWKDDNGKWCYAVFYHCRDGRYVYVRRHDSFWDDDWWFVGLRK